MSDKKNCARTLTHTIAPIYDQNSRVLILGSFPSALSRARGYNYAHPQNRFWRVLSSIFNEEIIDRQDFILRHHLALWDVIASCEIVGSSDTSIKNVQVNNIAKLVKTALIEHIFTTGSKAFQLYQRYLATQISLPVTPLPSTSPANAKMKLPDLIAAYQQIAEIVKVRNDFS